MMSVVWENSSDVIGLSIKKSAGGVITLLSPTFLKLYNDSDCNNHNSSSSSSSNDNDNSDDGGGYNGGSSKSQFEISSKGAAFELDAKYFTSSNDNDNNDGTKDNNDNQDKDNNDQSHHQPTKILPSSVSEVEFGNMMDSAKRMMDGVTSTGSSSPKKEELGPISELVVKAWRLKNDTNMLLHDLVRKRNDIEETIRCEANITRLEENALVIVVRNISERFHRFEAEKKAVSETTARKKDAAVNRFTRHEVKNGLLAAIGLCDNLKECLQSNNNKSEIEGNKDDRDTTEKRILFDLDKTLHEILDTVLAEAMARDVIHEVYEPKHERVNITQLIQTTSNNTVTADSMERFPIVTEPSPLPDMELDPQLLKYIHRNATSNACKYGKRGGIVLTEIKWDREEGVLYMNVINLPGNKHDEILKLGNLASEIIFSPARRLSIHSDSKSNVTTASHSSGDGAWVMHKCAKTLGGNCDIKVRTEVYSKYYFYGSISCTSLILASSL